MIRSFRPVLLRPLVAALLLAAAAAGCSKGGRSSTAPDPSPTADATATVAGQVVSVPTGASRGGIDVRLDAPSLATSTDASGRFRFDGVAPGERRLSFSSPRVQADLRLGVSPGQSVQIGVALTASSASLSGGGGSNDDGSNDDNSNDDNFLEMDFNPDEWPVDGEFGRGRITARFEGAGFERIDPSSVVLLGTARTLAPYETEREPRELNADFDPREVLAAFGHPPAGTTLTARVRFRMDGSSRELSDRVRIVAADD
jgi:hypothetical protein